MAEIKLRWNSYSHRWSSLVDCYETFGDFITENSVIPKLQEISTSKHLGAICKIAPAGAGGLLQLIGYCSSQEVKKTLFSAIFASSALQICKIVFPQWDTPRGVPF